jgi:hypothetical protein
MRGNGRVPLGATAAVAAPPGAHLPNSPISEEIQKIQRDNANCKMATCQSQQMDLIISCMERRLREKRSHGEVDQEHDSFLQTQLNDMKDFQISVLQENMGLLRGQPMQRIARRYSNSSEGSGFSSASLSTRGASPVNSPLSPGRITTVGFEQAFADTLELGSAVAHNANV